jgi:tetratricopeptide (TPR) repeat protein
VNTAERRARPAPGWRTLAALAAGALLFAAATAELRPRPGEIRAWEPQLDVIWPEPAAVLLAGGEPFLAANLKVIRAMANATKVKTAERKARFAKLMASAMRINAANADGYYLAQAMLPWNGYVELNQTIQQRAASARPWDWLPAFFTGFNLYYFKKDPEAAVPHLRQAAERSPENRANMEAIAAHWKALGHDPEEALRMIRSMADSANSRALWMELRKRERQLEGLIRLRQAAAAFREANGQPPESFQDLIGYAGLEAIPPDPLGEGFALRPNGEIRIAPPKPLKEEPQLP